MSLEPAGSEGPQTLLNKSLEQGDPHCSPGRLTGCFLLLSIGLTPRSCPMSQGCPQNGVHPTNSLSDHDSPHQSGLKVSTG